MNRWSLEYSFDVEPKSRVVYEKIYGIWRKETAEHYHEDFREAVSPLIDRPWAKLVDLSHWKTSFPDMVRVIARHLRWCRQNNMALSVNVIDNPSTFRQLNEMFSTGGTREISHTFRSRAEGERFLRVEWLEKVRS
ncbi:hypothetical protein GF377_10610 [candidate division GN15 bacterium]|nr:hypothetical protein [candidate division GN15 bacterium]